MKHTPKPWEAYNSHRGVIFQRWRVGSKGKALGVTLSVAVLANEDDGVSGDEQVANAHLIAAAPELQDFVIQYLWSEHGICDPLHEACPFSPEQLRDKAIAVLAQSEGITNGL